MRIERLTLSFVAVPVLAIALSSPLWASVPFSGTLTAEHACQAYVSKNKKTNPNQQLLRIGDTYSIFETNTDDDPQWYRIRIEGADPPERWVHKFCGPIDTTSPLPPNGGESCPLTNCNQPDTEESYLLALSWEPAFCETAQGQDKPECAIDDPNVYQATNFTLHGLWPNKLSQCSTHYGYCGSVCKRPGGSMCNYPALVLTADTRTDLAGVMPSVNAGSCLQRHEWWKHGTCSGMLTDDYFELAAALTRQFNEAGMAALMENNLDGTVAVEEFLTTVDSAFGPGTRNLLDLDCKSDNLTEVRIKLPKDVALGSTLEDLLSRMDKSSSRITSNCGSSFKVDRIGQ